MSHFRHIQFKIQLILHQDNESCFITKIFSIVLLFALYYAYAKLMYLPKVLVIIDVKPKDLGLPTEAYISVEEVHDVSTWT